MLGGNTFSLKLRLHGAIQICLLLLLLFFLGKLFIVTLTWPLTQHVRVAENRSF